jgi:phage shock protein A
VAEELERTKADLARSRSDFERLRGELDEMADEVQQMTAEAPAPGVAQAAEESAQRVEALERQVADLESLRRSEVGELQRAQESLASTQVELADAQRKLHAAEDRIRDLQHEAAEARAAAERAPEVVPAPTYGAPREDLAPAAAGDTSQVSSFAARISSLRQEIAAHVEERSGVRPEDLEPDAGELVPLRERLARAAAARQRSES